MSFPVFVLGSSAIVFATVVGTSLLSRWRNLALIAAFVGATGLLFFHGPGYLNTVPDDAYISFHYAEHLADGLGPNWNSSGRVEGYTNFSLVALLAALHKIGLDIVFSARVLGCLSALGTFVAIFGIWKLWNADEPEAGLGHPSVPAAVFLLLGLSTGFAYYAFSGLETPLFMLLLTTSAYLYFRERRGHGVGWSALALAAAAMTRPEGVIAAVVTGLFKLTEVWGSPERARTFRRVSTWAAAFLVLYGSYFLWRYTYYGYLFPNTFYAKTGASAAAFTRGIDYLRENGLQYQLLLMFASATLLLARLRIRRDVAYVMVLCGSLLAAVIFEGGDFMPNGRFVVPVLPLLYLCAASGFTVLLKRATANPTQAALIAASVLSLTGLSFLHDSSSTVGDRFVYRTSRPLADWFRAYTPSNFRIGAVAVGSLSYYSDRDIIDLVGINDSVIAHTDVPGYGEGTLAHEKYNTAYVLNTARPEIIIGPTILAPARREGIELTLVGALNYLYAEPRLWAEYQISPVLIDGWWYNLFVRNDVLSDLHGAGLAQPRNLLPNPGNTSTDGWQASNSSLRSSEDGLVVSSTGPAYGAAQLTTDTVRVPGRRYLAVAWVRGTASSAGSPITISLGEDGAPGSESKASLLLSTAWQPVWVMHTLQQHDQGRLSIRLTSGANLPQRDAFTIQDAQIRPVEN